MFTNLCRSESKTLTNQINLSSMIFKCSKVININYSLVCIYCKKNIENKLFRVQKM